MPASPTFIDGDYTVLTAITPLVKTQAFPGVNDLLIGTQEYVQYAANFSPGVIGAPHPDEIDPAHPIFMLASEGDFQDLGSGIQKWTRTYVRRPAEYSEGQGTFGYNFIGYYGFIAVQAAGGGTIVTTNVTGRNRFVQIVPVIATRRFFIIGPQSYADFGTVQEIPTIDEQQYYVGSADLKTDLLSDSPPFTLASTPTRSEYETMVANGDLIVAQPSNISRWMGNIYMRETHYVVAR